MQTVAELREVLSKLELLLGPSCAAASKEEEERVVLALKGIRNIGQLIGSRETLQRCYQSRDNAMVVRVAVLETIRKWQLSCQFSEEDTGLMNTFRDNQEDAELRINAYLALMTCPTEGIIETIKTILDTEEVNQGL